MARICATEGVEGARVAAEAGAVEDPASCLGAANAATDTLAKRQPRSTTCVDLNIQILLYIEPGDQGAHGPHQPIGLGITFEL
jgi:hypothetical protein